MNKPELFVLRVSSSESSSAPSGAGDRAYEGRTYRSAPQATLAPRIVLLALLAGCTVGGIVALLHHGPAHLVGAGWGEGCDEEGMA